MDVGWPCEAKRTEAACVCLQSNERTYKQPISYLCYFCRSGGSFFFSACCTLPRIVLMCVEAQTRTEFGFSLQFVHYVLMSYSAHTVSSSVHTLLKTIRYPFGHKWNAGHNSTCSKCHPHAPNKVTSGRSDVSIAKNCLVALIFRPKNPIQFPQKSLPGYMVSQQSVCNGA